MWILYKNIQKKWVKLNNPQNIFEALRIIITLQQLHGLLPYTLKITSNGQLQSNLSIFGVTNIILHLITYIISLSIIVVNKYSLKFTLVESTVFDFYILIKGTLLIINTILIILRLTIFKYKMLKLIHIMFTLENCFAGIRVDVKKSFKYMFYCTIFLGILGQSMLLGILINNFYYYTKIHGSNNYLVYAYCVATIIPWMFLQVTFYTYFGLITLCVHGNLILNKVLLNVCICQGAK